MRCEATVPDRSYSWINCSPSARGWHHAADKKYDPKTLPRIDVRAGWVDRDPEGDELSNGAGLLSPVLPM